MLSELPLIAVMTTIPLLLLLLIGASIWVARRWTIDYRAAVAGKPNGTPPGRHVPRRAQSRSPHSAHSSSLLRKTGGEHVLGLRAEQSRMTALFSVWEWSGGRLTGHFEAKAWFSTAAILAGSLWFYTVRFFDLNPQRSLLPCFAAPATKNPGVLAIKYIQGFVGGWR